VFATSTLLAGKINIHRQPFRWLHHVGEYSFSLYLYHFPLLLLCYPILVSFTGKLINFSHFYWLFIPIVTLISYYLYTITERVAIRIFKGI
jgi:peptidoglycan/LPS O-acetylase OafA/YrhL